MKTIFGVKYRILERSEESMRGTMYSTYVLDQRSISTAFMWERVSSNNNIDKLKDIVIKESTPKVAKFTEVWRS
jgi:hypothetical protein